MTSDVRRSDSQIFAQTRLAEDLLESLLELGIVLEFLDERDSVSGLGEDSGFRVDAVERDECKATCAFTHHDVDDLGRSGIGVDDDVEQTVSSGDFHCDVVFPILDFEELVEWAVDVVFEAESFDDVVECAKAAAGILEVLSAKIRVTNF